MKGKSRQKEDLALLEDLARQLDITVRYEKVAARGGLCRHNERFHVIIDAKSTDEFKIEILKQSLLKFDLSALFIQPRLRDILELGE